MAVTSVTDRLRRAGCVFAEDEAALLHDAASDPAELDALVARRVEGEPLEHLLGWVQFGDRRLAVGPGVFVPRRRSVLLVTVAVAMAGTRRDLVVVEMCCGAAAVAAVLADRLAGQLAELHAADVDPIAAGYARRNLPAPPLGRVHVGDLFAALPAELAGRIDLLVANAPYVPTAAVSLMPPEARLHEPAVALDGGDDGLAVQRRIAADALHWLAPGGAVLVETSERQAPGSLELLRANGFQAEIRRDDDLDGTVAIGLAPGVAR